MDTTEKKAFRKSFMGGFSKDDVNRYIEESNQRNAEIIATLDQRLRETEGARADAVTKLRSAEAEASALREKAQELDVVAP